MLMNNEKLITALQALTTTLKNITAVIAANNHPNLSALAETFTQQYEQLKTLASQIKKENLTYEFCEATAEIAELITELRLMENPVPQLLATTNLIPTFNACIALLKKTLYQHEGLTKEGEETLPTGDSIEAVTARAETAARNSAAASMRAEKASQIGLQQADELKELQRQTHNGILDPDMIERNVRHTLIMYLQNTAAVIAADESATAIAELEALLRNVD